MNAQLKKKWIKALRSGKYQQGRLALMDATGEDQPRFCCLGVLVHCVTPNSQTLNNNQLLTESQLKKFGINEDQQEILSIKNDQDRWSFKRIATYIEKHL